MSIPAVRQEPSAARSAVPLPVAVLIGVLAAAAALASGQLAAALLAAASSPFFAVADTVIRLSPAWLTEFGKSLGPVLDKLLLQVGVAVAVIGLAVLAGVVSRRRGAAWGIGIIAVLGLLGIAAVAAAPAFSPVDLIAPALALMAGTATFAGLHRLAIAAYVTTSPAERLTADHGPADHGPADHSPAEHGPADRNPIERTSSDDGPAAPTEAIGRQAGLSRRAMLTVASAGVGLLSVGVGAGGVLVANGVVGGGIEDSRRVLTARLARARLTEGAPAIPQGTAFPELGTPPFLTSIAAFYRIDTALRIPAQTAEAWRMRIHGMVDRELTLTVEDLLARPLVERTITMTCVSNPIGGDLVSTANFVGVDLRELLLEAGVRPGADQIFSTSLDGWYTGTPTDVVLEPDRGAMLAIGMNGESLLPEHGFPVRMVVPGLYGYVSATKWLADVELTTFDRKKGYWLERQWAQKAPIKTQSRIDHPRGFATVGTGTVTVAGIAWAQPTGISRVEVRMDGGPWREATLSTPVNNRTWRMWRTDFDLSPGSHTVQSRATDLDGVTQIEMRTDPIPDGASGWPATIFTVA